jgi:hypothetical protein
MELVSVGDVSWASPDRSAFLFDGLAITLQQWCERASDGDETGVRVEIQHLTQSEPEDATTEFAAKVFHIAVPIWRVDIFSLSSGTPGNFDRAHFHPRFNGAEPCDREWDAALATSPFDWLREKLSRVDDLLVIAGFPDAEGSDDVRRIAHRSEAIGVMAEELMLEAGAVTPTFLPKNSVST